MPITRYARNGGFRVTGIDVSPSMIDLARERAPGGEWQVFDMRSLALGQKFGALSYGQTSTLNVNRAFVANALCVRPRMD